MEDGCQPGRTCSACGPGSSALLQQIAAGWPAACPAHTCPGCSAQCSTSSGQRGTSQHFPALASRAAQNQAHHPPTCGCCPCSSSSWAREGKMTAVSSSSEGCCSAAVRCSKSSADMAVTTPEGKREPKRPARPATCTQMEGRLRTMRRCSQPCQPVNQACQPASHQDRPASPGRTARAQPARPPA